jgi:quinol monooxygenase YgiN
MKLIATVALAATLAQLPMPHLATAGDLSQRIDQGDVFVIATFRVKPEREAEFVQIMKQVVVDTRGEVGNVDYRLHKVVGTSHTYVTYEVFKDQAAAEAHNAADHIKRIVPPLLEMLDGELGIKALEPLR